MLLSPAVGFIWRPLPKHFVKHVRGTLDDPSLPPPAGTDYADAGFGAKLFGGGGGWGKMNATLGLASYRGTWVGKLMPDQPCSDDAELHTLCRSVRDYYLGRLSVAGAEQDKTELPTCGLWVGHVRWPADARRDIQQFVTVSVFPREADRSITVTIGFAGGAVGWWTGPDGTTS